MSIEHLNPKESPLPDIAISTTPKGKDILKVLFDLSFMTQEGALHFSKLILETPTDTSITLNISWLLKVPIPDNIFSVEGKLLYLLEISSQSTEFLKEQPSATSNLPSETKVHTLDVPAHMPLLLVTLKMVQEQELDCHPVQEKLFQETVELQLESLQVEVEMRSPS